MIKDWKYPRENSKRVDHFFQVLEEHRKAILEDNTDADFSKNLNIYSLSADPELVEKVGQVDLELFTALAQFEYYSIQQNKRHPVNFGGRCKPNQYLRWREMIDLSFRFKFDGSHSAFERAEKLLNETKNETPGFSGFGKLRILLRRRMEERITQSRDKYEKKMREMKEEKREIQTGGVVLLTVGLDVLKQIMSSLPPSKGNWFNFMLTCRQFSEAGRKFFDPSIKICGEYPVVFSAARGQIESLKYLLRHPKVDLFVNGNEALREACERGKVESMRLLINDPRVGQQKAHLLSDVPNDSKTLRFLMEEVKDVPMSIYWFKACVLNDKEALERITKEDASNCDPWLAVTTNCLEGIHLLMYEDGRNWNKERWARLERAAKENKPMLACLKKGKKMKKK
eukprot:TRINITY_DN5597_c0_g1_i1.p1 TRINITY_DN5597_c0_g1~~TRINITY_DN5597_c0_g1_i1.p1  ORF type:complete len:398 (+),score=125.94 TRINITY_DN5597_c0_g1_i1:51-1244(+)